MSIFFLLFDEIRVIINSYQTDHKICILTQNVVVFATPLVAGFGYYLERILTVPIFICIGRTY